jgi:hypothetical protein
MPKTLAQLRADPRVREVVHDDEGWWCLLRGARTVEGGHQIHEATPQALLRAFADAVVRFPCGCSECRAP